MKLIDDYIQSCKESPIVVAFTLSLIFIAFLQPISVGFVIGSSMEPNHYQGDIVIASNFQEPEVGEVVFFNRPQDEQDIVHRVISKEDEGVYITKGDNNEASDGIVKEEHIKGIAVSHLETSELDNFFFGFGIVILITTSAFLALSMIFYVPVKSLFLIYYNYNKIKEKVLNISKIHDKYGD